VIQLRELIKALILIGALLLTSPIYVLDTATGSIPNLTILYLIPVIAVTIFVRLEYGLIVAVYIQLQLLSLMLNPG
jgi:hypothetical protein